jgi:hypothetical protein
MKAHDLRLTGEARVRSPHHSEQVKTRVDLRWGGEGYPTCVQAKEALAPFGGMKHLGIVGLTMVALGTTVIMRSCSFVP